MNALKPFGEWGINLRYNIIKKLILILLIVAFCLIVVIDFKQEDFNMVNVLRVHVNPLYDAILNQESYDLNSSTDRVTLTDLKGIVYETNHPNYTINDYIDLKEFLYQDHTYTEMTDGWHKLSLPLYLDNTVSGFAIFEIKKDVLLQETNGYEKYSVQSWMRLLLIFLIGFSSVLVLYQPKENLVRLNDGLSNFTKGIFIPIVTPKYSQYHDLYDHYNQAVDEMSYLIERQSMEEQKQKEFLTIISHELKTPISTINAYIEGLILGIAKDESDQIEYQKIIHEKMQHLSQQVNGLFEYAQENSDRFKYNFEELYADVYFKEVFDHLPHDKRIKINNMLPGCMINIDRVRLEQVVMNLYNNAVKHTTDDEEIFFTAYRQDSEIIIEVKDAGSGIEAHDLPHIFEYYYQGTDSKHHDYQGIGLGLAICKEIIDRHQGRIQVKSNITVGTSFLIGIPIV